MKEPVQKAAFDAAMAHRSEVRMREILERRLPAPRNDAQRPERSAIIAPEADGPSSD
jgi:hypothetical protein